MAGFGGRLERWHRLARRPWSGVLAVGIGVLLPWAATPAFAADEQVIETGDGAAEGEPPAQAPQAAEAMETSENDSDVDDKSGEKVGDNEPDTLETSATDEATDNPTAKEGLPTDGGDVPSAEAAFAVVGPPPPPPPEMPVDFMGPPMPPADGVWPPVEKEGEDEAWARPDEGSGDRVADGPKFIKGQLIFPAKRRLVSTYDHFGIAFGPNIIGTSSSVYLKVDPRMGWYGENWSLALHAPVNLLAGEIVGLKPKLGNFLIRREDWDELSDFGKIIWFANYGAKEDNFYVSLNSIDPTTLGHGMVIRTYQPGLDVDRQLTNARFDAYNDYGGFELFVNDVFFQGQVVGGLAFIKPGSFFSNNTGLRSLSFGVEYAADFKAPTCILKSAGSSECVQAQGSSADIERFGTAERRPGASLDNTFVRSDPENGRFAVKTTTVQVIGLSTEYKYLKTEKSDLKAYGTWHRFMNAGGGDGFGIGTLGRFSFGSRWINAFRLRLEYRTFSDGFLPGYFDTIYEIGKYEHAHQRRDVQVTPTKYQAVFGDPENGFARPNNGYQHGYRLEASWGLFKGSRSNKQVSFGFGLYDSGAPDDSTFFMHVEYPMLGILNLFATFMRVNEPSFDALFGPDFFTGPGGILLSGLRLQVLPIMFINIHYSRSFAVGRSAGQEYHLGNSSVVDSNGNSTTLPHDRLFETAGTLSFELEFGWEFSEDDDDEG